MARSRHSREIVAFSEEELKTSFVLLGSNRHEAFAEHLQYEFGFNDPDNPYVKMGFREFCRELNQGYGRSKWTQIARLWEAPNGMIYYDRYWCD